MEYIYPLQQQTVKEIFLAFCDDARVRSAVLFGSSVNIRCTRDSDFDIAVRLEDGYATKEVKNAVSEKLQEICLWRADFLWYDELDPSEQIYEDILKGGRLYEQIAAKSAG